MAVGSFYYPTTPTVSTTYTDGPLNLAMQFAVAASGTNCLGAKFWKVAGDTGTHTATLFRVSDSASLATATFTGESASGWQSVNFSSPVPLVGGQSYRISISHPSQYPGITYGGTAIGTYTVSSNAYYAYGPATTLPNVAWASHLGADAIVDGIPATQITGSQLTAETWASSATTSPTPLRASQVLAEAWINTTQLWSSQLTGETWEQMTARLQASQAAAEVWYANAIFLMSSQMAAETWVMNVPRIASSQLAAEVWTPTAPAPAWRRYQESQWVV